jgi:hypothetical protein
MPTSEKLLPKSWRSFVTIGGEQELGQQLGEPL